MAARCRTLGGHTTFTADEETVDGLETTFDLLPAIWKWDKIYWPLSCRRFCLKLKMWLYFILFLDDVIRMTSSNGNIFHFTCQLQRPVTPSFWCFFDLRLNKRLSKGSRCHWFETPSCSLWWHRNDATDSWNSLPRKTAICTFISLHRANIRAAADDLVPCATNH